MRHEFESSHDRWRSARSARHVLIASLLGVALAIAASSVSASITIGQLGSGGGPCLNDYDFLQPSVTSGIAYSAPETGTITSWSTNGPVGAGATMTMKIWHPGGPVFTAIAHDGPRSLEPGRVDTFPVSIPVATGDLLALHTVTGGPACVFPVPGEKLFARMGEVPDGVSTSFGPSEALVDGRLNISATLAPANTIRIVAVRRKTRKGIANLTVTVPNPGTLSVAGKGARLAEGGSRKVVVVQTAGEVALAIAAKGRKSAVLQDRGKAKLRPKIVYTPTGGDPGTKRIKLTLLKKS
jgi:hypothetical protein